MLTWTCRAILFDMDGTLIDSEAAVVRQWKRFAQRHGLPIEEVLRVSHGRRTLETMQLVAPHLPQPDEADAFMAAESTDLSDVAAIDGTRELLLSLPRERWAVVTSSPVSVAVARLRHTGLPEPHVLVAADHVTRGKPNPEPWMTAADLLRVDPQDCLVFEDANAGIFAAQAAGMQVIGAGWSHRETLLCETLVASYRDLAVQVKGDSIVLRLHQNH